ncbi:translocation/assembly module TamB domain-containing protein [Maribacter sp. 2307ULW6-5]|uniref:translocation/assembly module TamB domain-containing protein n=1 Tax=Maribacter sp. 2307ULW6-5 TaxID=3386275 RepID=UPI0039BCCDB3
MGTLVFSLPVVQTQLAKEVTHSINQRYGTHIHIDRLKVSFISWDTQLEGIFVEDYQKDTLFFAKALKTSILSVGQLAKGQLQFGDVAVDSLHFKLKRYANATESNIEVFVNKLDARKERDPNTPPFQLSAASITLANSTFEYVDENLEKPQVLLFRGLEIAAEDFYILGPEVAANIRDMSFRSSRNLEVQRLATRFKYTREQMRFDSLAVATPLSDIQGNLVFNYDRKDFKDFLNKVNIDATFTESTVSFDEVNQLYNEFGKGKVATFNARVSGVLNDLNTDELLLIYDNTGIRGDFNFKNLFNKNQGFVLDARMKNVTSSYYQLNALLPNLVGNSLPSTFNKLGQFTIRGDALITRSSIDTEVNINTAIGSSYADLVLTDLDNIDAAAYKGFVSLIDFDLGSFVERNSLGKTTLDFNVEGKGFVAKSLDTEVVGQVYAIDFNNYTYKDLKVSGVLKDQLFDGSLVSNDQNVRFDFKGLADLSTERNNFNFVATVDYADLRTLNFINDSISIFKGKVLMDIDGSTLDNLVGDINFTDTSYENVNDAYFFEDFTITSSFGEDGSRTIDIDSPDIITGYMKGNFKVGELGRLLQNSLGSIYTNFRPFAISSGQNLTFNFKIYNKIVDIFFPEVTFDPNTFIKGKIVADEGDFKLNFESPSIVAYGTEADDIELKIDNKNPLFNTYVAVGYLKTPYYNVQDFNLINTTLKDTLFFRSEFMGGSEFNDTYNLNFYHTFNQDNKSVIGLKKSDISFKGNKWILNQSGDSKNKVIINRTLDSISIQEIVMNNEQTEQIRLKGQLADSTFKDLQLQFKIVSLDKITPDIPNLKLDGEVNGTLNVLQKDGIYLPSSNLNIDGFGVNDMTMGNLALSIVGNRDLTEFQVNSQLSDGGVDVFGVLGKIGNRGRVPQLDLIANFNNFQMQPFSPLGKGVIDRIRGELDGRVLITGPVDNPSFSGLLTMDNAGMAIPYLNTNYGFGPRSRVLLSGQTFDFQQVAVTDVAKGSSATLDGVINHTAFDDWVLNLNVDTNDRRFLILNKEFEEGALYYGTGFLDGTGRIFGPTTALNIVVDGETARGTSLKIPLSDVASVGDYSFINFVEKSDGTAIEEQRQLKEYQGLELEFNLDVTPEAEVEIVTDTKTGSSLRGTGEGILLIQINTNGKFEMYGDFVVVTGQFDYKFGGIIDKSFRVKPGGRINWDQKPLEADLDMEAVYSLNANPAPLLDSQGFTARIPTDVVIKLTGELQSPDIAFGIDFPGTNSVVQSELEYRLQDPTVAEKNAIFLLAQGTFVNEQNGINQQAITGNLVQSASGILNSLLGGGNDKFNFGLSYEQGNLNRNADAGIDDRIGVTVSTQISDRVLFNGRVGVPVGASSQNLVAGDFEIQLLLNDEGTLSAKFFSRQSEIQAFLPDQQGSTQGAGVSYEVDFDTFRGLFRKIFGQIEKERQEREGAKAPLPKPIVGKDGLVGPRRSANPF